MKRRSSRIKASSIQEPRKKRIRRSSADNSSQEVDQSPPEIKTEPPPPEIKLDPMQMYNISAQILSYLDVKDLKVARQVCTLWALQGAKMLLEKSYLHVATVLKSPNGSKKMRKGLKRFLSVPGSTKYLKIIFHRNDDLKQVMYLLDRVPLLRKRACELHFQGIKQERPLIGLSQLIRKLPRLQILNTKYLTLTGWRSHCLMKK